MYTDADNCLAKLHPARKELMMRQENVGGKRLNKMLTVDDIADIFKVHPCTIRRWEKKGRLKSYHLGGYACIRFKREEILNFIESSRK